MVTESHLVKVLSNNAIHFGKSANHVPPWSVVGVKSENGTYTSGGKTNQWTIKVAVSKHFTVPASPTVMNRVVTKFFALDAQIVRRKWGGRAVFDEMPC
mmetsp:Transcript_4546/g.7171  ORF Transcript_4546/g.7171 Transcript_4546/m.7171 type:complete len:99 (-) Transcript_4546:106-402(-)